MLKMFAGLVIAGGVLAAPANADSGRWICDALDSSPRESTVVTLVYTILGMGYDQDSGAELFVSAVKNYCPEYIPLVLSAVNQYT